MTKRASQNVTRLIATTLEHFDRAVLAQEAEAGINHLRCGVDVARQAVAAGADLEQRQHLAREAAEVELVFQCRGWA